MAGNEEKSGNAPGASGEMTTKERIFSVAIDLFAEKGFDAVSLREIAEASGVRKATLYYYFATKDEILGQIFDFFLAEWRKSLVGRWSEASEAETQIVAMGLDGFMAMGTGVFTGWLGNPRMEKIMRISFIEMYHNETIRKSQVAFVDGGYTFFESSFAVMAKHGLIRPVEPKVAAMEYMSFFMNALLDYFLFRYDTRSGSFIDMYRTRIDEHTAFLTNALRP